MVLRYMRKLMKCRIEHYQQIKTKEQTSFRVGISTMDHVFSLTETMEKKVAKIQEISVMFIDLKTNSVLLAKFNTTKILQELK